MSLAMCVIQLTVFDNRRHLSWISSALRQSDILSLPWALSVEIALAAGAPWGAYAMGGAFPGQFPPTLRVGAVVQAALLLLMAAAVYRGEVLRCPDGHGRPAGWAWVVVAFAVVSLVLYLITPSAGERMIWVPVAVLLLVTSLIVAVGGPANVPGTTPGSIVAFPGVS